MYKRGNYSSGDDFVLEYGDLRFTFNERDFRERCEQAARKVGFIEDEVEQHVIFPGKFRGGLALSKTVRCTDTPMTFSYMSDRQKLSPWGLHGGLPGAKDGPRVFDTLAWDFQIGASSWNGAGR